MSRECNCLRRLKTAAPRLPGNEAYCLVHIALAYQDRPVGVIQPICLHFSNTYSFDAYRFIPQ